MSLAARRVLSSFASTCLALALVVGGCDCGDDDIVESCVCSSDSDCAGQSGTCGGGENTYCDLEAKRCKQDKFECDASSGHDGDCCPGQICSSLAEICTNRYVTCTDDSACIVKGQVCTALGNPPGDKGCTFERCGENGACGEGLSCFNGYCVGEAPCNGGCPSGQVCVPASNRCFRPGPEPEWPTSCAQSCEPGTVLVFVDGENVFDRCDRSPEARSCECQALPPIQPRDMARHSSSVVSGGKVLVSAYDADHGDLVVHTFDRAGKLEKTEWVDGVPSSGAVVADPNGPRGGRATPGENVGQYTSIASDGSLVHVAYYAVEDGGTQLGDLRYARRSASGAWTTHVVDGSDGNVDTGDVGLFTSLTLSPDGFPVVSYFQRGGMGNDAFKTAVKVARAKVKEPTKASDWSIVTVDEGSRTPPPCANPACTADEVCTVSSSNPNGQCRTKAARASECSPACSNTEACALNSAGVPSCFESLREATLASLPEGNGLFSSIAYIDSRPVVVWYDGNNGQLKGSIAASDSASAGPSFTDKRVLDDGAGFGALANDVGLFPSVAVGPADASKRIAVSYFDSSARQLKVLTARDNWADITPTNLRVADRGVGNPEIDPMLFVGADTSVAFDASKNVVVAYQDSTAGDLRIARQQSGGNSFEVSTLRSEGGCGFYTSLSKDASGLVVSHAVIKAESASKSANRLEVVAVP